MCTATRPPSPPTPTRPLFQSTLRTFFWPSQALKLAMATLVLPRHDGVAGCKSEPEDAFTLDKPLRTSYRVTVRSVDAASAILPSAFKVRSTKGFSDAVYRKYPVLNVPQPHSGVEPTTVGRTITSKDDTRYSRCMGLEHRHWYLSLWLAHGIIFAI
ncbi:microtubule-associated protein ytm1 [Moniliophthora roreri]|nr:microtubule-associated protein ytm1 [Moniliophthora roreri]